MHIRDKRKRERVIREIAGKGKTSRRRGELAKWARRALKKK